MDTNDTDRQPGEQHAEPDEHPAAPAEEPAAPEEQPAWARFRRWRARIRSKPALGLFWRFWVFVVGLAFIASGVALSVLPGPLTIPPVLLGLWLWSTEFEWAHRFLQPFRRKGKEAWERAKAHPVSATAVTVGGLVAAGAAFWAVNHFRLVEQAREYLDL